MGLSNYFNIYNSYPFYGAYHNEWRNELIHIICIPLIFTSGLSFGHHLDLYWGLTLGDAVAIFYAISFVVMEPKAGLMYAPIIACMNWVAMAFLLPRVALAVGVHVSGWLAQFIGHGFFEKRKPALFDNLPQAIHAAVFFVWLEVLFAVGYRPELKAQLRAKVEEELRRYREQQHRD